MSSEHQYCDWDYGDSDFPLGYSGPPFVDTLLSSQKPSLPVARSKKGALKKKKEKKKINKNKIKKSPR